MYEVGDDRLSIYDLHEQTWEHYDDLREAFEWVLPETFNTATYISERWAASDPDRVAIRSEGADGDVATVTYLELDERANQLANFLSNRGISTGDRVAVNAPQKPEAIITMIATWKLGGVVVPLSVLFGHQGLAYRLRDAGVNAFVVDAAAVDTYREIRDDVKLDTVLTVDTSPTGDEQAFDEAIEGCGTTFETTATSPHDDAAILYTSGTTGDPKGVRHGHRFLLANLMGYQMHACSVTLEEDDLLWSPVEWSWAGALYVLVLPTLYYGRSILGTPRGGFDPEDALRRIESHEVTLFFAPATVLRMTLNSDATDDYDLSSVRVLSSGGESLDQEIRDRIRGIFGDISIQEAYGQTEAVSLVVGCEAYFPSKPGMIGRPYPGQDVTIVDPQTYEPLETGEIGEIAVPYDDNPLCFKEYWNKPEKTAEKVQDGWLLTEDLGWEDEEGYIGYHSRKDDVIITSGYRVSPTEIEESLAPHDAVANVAVVGVPDDERGEIPKAFVVLEPGIEANDATKEALQSYTKETLAKYEYPRAIEFMDSLPTTTTGKIRREDLKE